MNNLFRAFLMALIALVPFMVEGRMVKFIEDSKSNDVFETPELTSVKKSVGTVAAEDTEDDEDEEDTEVVINNEEQKVADTKALNDGKVTDLFDAANPATLFDDKEMENFFNGPEMKAAMDDMQKMMEENPEAWKEYTAQAERMLEELMANPAGFEKFTSQFEADMAKAEKKI